MSKQKRKVSLIKPQSLVKVVQTICDVVIPFHNGFSFFKPTLDALPDAVGKHYQNSTETLVDDQSDPTKLGEFTPQISTKFRIIHNKIRTGFPGSCNFGISKGRGKYIALVNSDCVMQPGSIELLIDEMEADDTIGVIGPKLLFPEDSTDPGRPAGRIQHAGLEMNVSSKIYHVFNGWSADTPKANIRREPLALTGAMLLIRRTDFDRVGGFPLSFGMGTWEDIDLCFSIRYMQQKVIYEPKSVGYHYVGATAIESREGFDVKGNEMLFKLRWGKFLVWSDWNVL